MLCRSAPIYVHLWSLSSPKQIKCHHRLVSWCQYSWSEPVVWRLIISKSGVGWAPCSQNTNKYSEYSTLEKYSIKLEELYRSIPNRQAWPFSSRHKHFDVCGFKNKNLNLSITLVNTTTGQHCRWPSLALCFNSVKALIKYSGVPLGSILGPFVFFSPSLCTRSLIEKESSWLSAV